MLTRLKRIFSPEEAVPEEAAIEWAHQNELTPDFWRLEQYIRQWLFVPDDMKRGGVNHHLIEEAINGPIETDVYTAHPYTMWKKDLGTQSYPIVLPADYVPSGRTIVPVEPAPIKGELYGIRPSAFISLDKHKLNGLQFFRTRVDVRVSYRTVRYERMTIDPETLLPVGSRRPLPIISEHGFVQFPAWMYQGFPDYWDPQLNGIFRSQMDLYEHDRPRVWIKKYYCFQG